MKKLLLSLILTQELIAAPIHNAVMDNDIERVRKILSYSPIWKFFYGDINSTDDFGLTPMYYVSNSGYVEIAELLIAAGIDVNAADSIGVTPLHRASYNGKTELAQLFIDNGTDINVRDVDGWTPLYWAAHNGLTEMVKFLIANPLCDHTIKNNKGKTPEDVARGKGYIRIAYILHNAPTVTQKILNSRVGLQLLAVKISNIRGVTKEEYAILPGLVKRYISNIIAGDD